jgi:hypothetical protein
MDAMLHDKPADSNCDWYDVLHEACYAINCTYHDVIKDMPYRIMFGMYPPQSQSHHQAEHDKEQNLIQYIDNILKDEEDNSNTRELETMLNDTNIDSDEETENNHNNNRMSMYIDNDKLNTSTISQPGTNASSTITSSGTADMGINKDESNDVDQIITINHNLGNPNSTHYAIREAAQKNYIATTNNMVEQHNKKAISAEKFKVGQYVSVLIPDKQRIKGFEKFNLPGVIIEVKATVNRYRVHTLSGLIQHELKPEQFIIVNNMAYPQLEKLNNIWSTSEAVSKTLKSKGKSIVQIYNQIINKKKKQRIIEKDKSVKQQQMQSRALILSQSITPVSNPSKQNKQTKRKSLDDKAKYVIGLDKDVKHDYGLPEYIVDERIVNNIKQYKITWVAYDDKDNTWEPAATFDNDNDYKLLVDNWNDYKKRHKLYIEFKT